MTDLETRIAWYEAQLEQLRSENEQLRRSAQAFGELAERLNRALLIASAAPSTIRELEAYSPPPPLPPSHPAPPALQGVPVSLLKRTAQAAPASNPP
jgi:hypothetical protein